jgi:hypothetical protein
MAWIKKHLKKIIGILVVLLILVGAYWYGGNAPGSRGFGRPGTTSENTESTTQKAVSEEASDTEDAEAEISDDAKWDDSSSSGQGSIKKNHSKRDTKKDDKGSEKDKSGIVTPDYSATTQEHKNGDTDVSEDPGTDSSQSTDNKTPSNGGGSSKKDGSGTEQPETEVPTTEQPGVQSPTTTEQPSEDTVYTCTISINCSNILSNWDIFDKTKASCVPSDGWILREMTVEFKKGQTVFDVLKNVTRTRAIQMEYSFTALYGSYYIEGINNLYEFDCGELSGWEYCVNGKFPAFGCSKYVLKDGDKIEWKYTCDLGADVGNPYFE